MQATRLVGALWPHRAGLADVAGKNEPHAGQRDAILRRQTIDDALENGVCRGGFADFQC
jgi:hypothetical protein